MKIYLETFGCRANQYDTERVRAMVERGGAIVVGDPAAADVAVFNSCAVTAEAEADLRKSVRRAARHNPNLRTVVMGCAAALDNGALSALPSVEHVVPGDDLDGVAVAVGVAVPASPLPGAQTGTRALLRVQTGCDEHCTFCATTIARGANRSRPPEELVREAGALAEQHREIVLTGVHIGTYGHDIGTTLGALVARLVSSVQGARFRLSSVEATEVDDELAGLFDSPENLTPHLHAPLQSGADRILKRMGRHWYSASSYARAVERLVSGKTVFALGADVIAGFPGETDADHLATLGLIRALPFTYLHVFPFSPRPGTAATRLPDPVRPEVAHRRARELRHLAADLGMRYRQGRIGGTADVIVVRGERREGLTGDYLTVTMGDRRFPRGTRVRTRLGGTPEQLLAVSTPASFEP